MSATDKPYLRFALCNGARVETDVLRVSPLSSGFMAGEGLFETVRVVKAGPVFLEAHYARLSTSLGKIGISPLATFAELSARCAQVIAANALINGSLKIVVFKDVANWTELILARQASYTLVHYEQGFRLKTFPCDLRVEPLNQLKSLNYLRNIYAKRSAVAAGFDEALFINPHQQVLEGATTNIFVVKGRTIGTPPLGSGILPGVMRAALIQQSILGTVQEQDITLNELLEADEVFVTNVLLGVMPVSGVDGRSYDLVRNAVTRSIRAGLGHD